MFRVFVGNRDGMLDVGIKMCWEVEEIGSLNRLRCRWWSIDVGSIGFVGGWSERWHLDDAMEV